MLPRLVINLASMTSTTLSPFISNQDSGVWYFRSFGEKWLRSWWYSLKLNVEGYRENHCYKMLDVKKCIVTKHKLLKKWKIGQVAQGKGGSGKGWRTIDSLLQGRDMSQMMGNCQIEIWGKIRLGENANTWEKRFPCSEQGLGGGGRICSSEGIDNDFGSIRTWNLIYDRTNQCFLSLYINNIAIPLKETLPHICTMYIQFIYCEQSEHREHITGCQFQKRKLFYF